MRSRPCGKPGTRGCSWRVTRSSRSSPTAPPRTGSRSSGGSAISHSRRSSEPSATRPWPSSPPGPSSTRAAPSFARFDRIVVHSENGRETLTGLGVEADKLRVIPHPVFSSDPERRDDGRTVLAFGMIRPYKGLGDAIEAVRRAGGARLLVAGDPLEPLEPYRAAANGLEVEWRLGYLSPPEIDLAFGDATLAVFPYRPELDQSGALLQALGAGVPAVAYDVGGIAEPVRRFGAGRVVPAGDVAGLAAAVHELLSDGDALEQARAGARRAREELTWDAAAHAHLALYEEIA